MNRARLARLASIAVVGVVVGVLGSALALGACGPGGGGQVTPVLPGDGDDNTAKPVDGSAGKPAKDPWAGRTDLIEAPPPPQPEVVNLPPVERFTLKNGLQVVVVADGTLPVVDMQLAVKVGGADETRPKAGLASFAAAMLTKGSKGKDGLAIAKAIDFVGGTLNASASFEATLLSCNVLSKDTRTCLDLLPAIALDASFPEAEIEAVREQLRGAIRARLDDAGSLAGAHFQNLLWGDDNVRGWTMSETTLDAIERADLVGWQKTWFKPGNAILAVAGDVDAKKLKTDLEKAFGRWVKGKTPARATYAEPKLNGLKVRLIDKPRQTQTHIRLGHLGIAHSDPRFYDSMVWNYVLGAGQFSSRLMKVVRSDAGKAYGASSLLDRNADRGSFVMTTYTGAESTVETIQLLVQELARMAQSGPTEGEVRDAIANIAGSYATRFESAGAIAGAVLAAELHGLDESYIRNYAVKIGAVTAKSAADAAGEILDAGDFVIVLVGDATVIEPQLEAAGLRYEKLSYEDPISKYEREAPAAPTDAKSVEAGKKIIDAALTAKGGEKTLAAIKNMTIVAAGQLIAQGQKKPLPASIQRVYASPDKVRVDLDIANGQYKATYTVAGSVGWAAEQGEVFDLPDDQVAALEIQRWHDHEFILLRGKEKDAKVAALPDEKIQGVTFDVVRIERGDGKSAVKIYLDKKTHLMVRMAYTEEGAKTIEEFADYKNVDGIQVAHTRVTNAPQTSSSVTLSSVTINGTVDDKVFAKP